MSACFLYCRRYIFIGNCPGTIVSRLTCPATGPKNSIKWGENCKHSFSSQFASMLPKRNAVNSYDFIIIYCRRRNNNVFQKIAKIPWNTYRKSSFNDLLIVNLQGRWRTGTCTANLMMIWGSPIYIMHYSPFSYPFTLLGQQWTWIGLVTAVQNQNELAKEMLKKN